MEELNMKYLRDERNWCFEEKFAKKKVTESSVWPAKILHQQQVRTDKENFSSYSIYHLSKKRWMKLQYVSLNCKDNYQQVFHH
jgi:hypothetical protein